LELGGWSVVGLGMAHHDQQRSNRHCFILLGDLFELYDDAWNCERQM
jgi:hypothetical protein